VRPAAAEIEATALVPAEPEQVFDFLSDLSNHWRLVDGYVEVVSVAGASGVVRLRGPLGVHRTVRTRVTEARRPDLIVGVAELSGGTRARVTWTLEGRTQVRLVASVEAASWFDRALLACGGRVWLKRRFAFGLSRLSALLRSDPRPQPSPLC
jgi:hypothetical protein